jgi:hypothetical protein
MHPSCFFPDTTLLAVAAAAAAVLNTPVHIKRNDNGSRGGHMPGKKAKPYLAGWHYHTIDLQLCTHV